MNVFVVSDFVERVPVFSVDAGLKDVLWELLKHSGEHAILYQTAAAAQSQPVGVLSLDALLSVLRSPQFSRGGAEAAIARLQDLLDRFPDLLEPMALLPPNLAPLEIQQRLEHSCVPHWGIDLGELAGGDRVRPMPEPSRWGLLNRLQLLQWLTEQRLTAPLPPCPNSPPEFYTSQLKTLVDLVEQLPLPLMLQTRTGQVLAQNTLWRTQIGQESVEAIAPFPSSPVDLDPLSEDTPPTPVEALPQFRPADAVHGETGAARCEVRAISALRAIAPDWQTPTPEQSDGHFFSRLCVCTQDNGEEQVWELIKVPLLLPRETFRTLGEDNEIWLVAAQDRTEQHQYARQLAVKTADLEQLTRFKNEFLSCISHEMKTPLTALLGLSTLLKDQLLGPLNERQLRYAQLIYQSGRHLMMIVNDILDVSRIETGQLHLKLESVAIETICWQSYNQACQWQSVEEEALRRSRAMAGPDTSGPPFELYIQPGLKTLIADPLRLRQMLSNLLCNSLQFTEVGSIGLEVEVWGRWLSFTVWDTGIGIAADQQVLLFQTFHPAEAAARKGEGTGLGLALTQRLARLHGGELSFISRQGTGSWFTLLLPVVPPQALGTPLGLGCPLPPNAKPLVLVAIADVTGLDSLLKGLQPLGCGVAIARTGPESLEKIRLLQPTAVLISPQLPLLAGWDVLTLTKASPETRSIPIWMIGSAVEEAQAISTGADGFLTLTLPPEELQRQLRPLLNLEPTPSQPTVFTVLHLRVGTTFATTAPDVTPTPELSHLLQDYPCRLLEVDDLDQADLLARVWHPDLILLEGELPDPGSFLQQFSQYERLRSLPLVTLTPENTQAANQIEGLTVYPCLASLAPGRDGRGPDALSLLQVMQVALGWR